MSEPTSADRGGPSSSDGLAEAVQAVEGTRGTIKAQVQIAKDAQDAIRAQEDVLSEQVLRLVALAARRQYPRSASVVLVEVETETSSELAVGEVLDADGADVLVGSEPDTVVKEAFAEAWVLNSWWSGLERHSTNDGRHPALDAWRWVIDIDSVLGATEAARTP